MIYLWHMVIFVGSSDSSSVFELNWDRHWGNHQALPDPANLLASACSRDAGMLFQRMLAIGPERCWMQVTGRSSDGKGMDQQINTIPENRLSRQTPKSVARNMTKRYQGRICKGTPWCRRSRARSPWQELCRSCCARSLCKDICGRCGRSCAGDPV